MIFIEYKKVSFLSCMIWSTDETTLMRILIRHWRSELSKKYSRRLSHWRLLFVHHCIPEASLYKKCCKVQGYHMQQQHGRISSHSKVQCAFWVDFQTDEVKLLNSFFFLLLLWQLYPFSKSATFMMLKHTFEIKEYLL